ncbi:MAG: family 65 glycosyl hydrolase, partial [Treponema sp.]|nr:family 65 glycosyl hydrolase [Treponema sp.]
MTKSADTFFLCDPWKITEEGWHRDRNLVSESVFSLGNEYMGVRGFFDEGLGICRDNGNRDGTDSNSPRTLRGLYFNGIYEIADLPKSYKGIVTKTHFMVNAVDWLYTEIRAGTDTLDLAVSEISGFRRVLDMKEGTLTRSFDWHTRSGQIIHLEFIRFLDMDNACRAYQRIACSALQGKIELTMVIANSFNTVHGWDRKNFWKVTRREWFERGAALLGEVLGSGQQVFSGFSLAVSAGAQLTKYESEKAAGFTVSLPLAAGTEAWIEKSVMNYAVKERPLARVHDQCSMPPEEQRGVPRHSSPEADTQPVWEKGMAELNRSRPGFEAARADNKKYWTAFWKNADIVIDGDPLNQQGIRFCIFQMHQTYHGYDPSNNIGAKGLTGEAYNGHTFWDTETYCLPFYLFSNLRA